jgi:hypothetical protein
MNKLGCCVDRELGYKHGCTEKTCMKLPEGKTCGDCIHIKRCLAFGFTKSEERKECDFFPRRFAIKT